MCHLSVLQKGIPSKTIDIYIFFEQKLCNVT